MPRRPLATLPRISCDDACHKRRGSLGGTDYVVGVGTPVYAMFSGMARFRVAGTGGWTVSIERDVDHQVGELMHLSRANGFVLGGARLAVTEGDLVAWSGGRKGAPGSGSATGPHLHAHVYVNGVRYGMEEYLANPAWAGGTPIPIITESNRRRKKTMLALLINDGLNKLGSGTHTYLTGPGYWLETTGHPTANEVSILVQGWGPDGKILDTPNLTYRELFDYALASGVCPPAELANLAAAAGVTLPPSSLTIGASSAEVAAAADRVIEAIPTTAVLS